MRGTGQTTYPALQKNRLRYAFWALWFVCVPLALAWLTTTLLAPGPGAYPEGFWGQLRWLVQDQQVPALIVFFTLYDIVLYHYRHSLPLAGPAGVAGRTDLPAESRRAYEHAGHLIEEVNQILRRHRAAVERAVPLRVREEITASLEDLEGTMKTAPFDERSFQERYESAHRLVQKTLHPWQKSAVREYAESILIAVGVALLLRAFVVEAFKIPSGSMLPTLQIQDHIFVNKSAYGPTVPWTELRLLADLPPKRGDVIVFEYPDENPRNESQDYIKRVIALPGDELRVEGGHPIINGWTVPSCRVDSYEFFEGEELGTKRGELFVEYLGDYAYLTLFEDDRSDGKQGPYYVKSHEVWVLGDNRNNSSDSRAWFGGRGGGVPFPNIKGRAMFVWLSFASNGSMTFDRLFTNVMGKPRLPKGAPDDVVQRIEQCLRERPSETVPPPPRQQDERRAAETSHPDESRSARAASSAADTTGP
jgi:signal peptidase I